MTRHVTTRWNLRQVMALKGLFQTSDLLPLLEDRDIHLTRQYVHKLVTIPPQRINTDLLAALCDILDCTPSDLLTVEAVEEQSAPRAVNGESGPAIGSIRPIRAKVRRPDGQ